MGVFVFVPKVKDHTDGIQTATYTQHHYYRQWQDGEETFTAGDQHPAHDKIDERGDDVEPAGEKHFEQNAYCCKSPQDRQHRDAESIVHIHQQKGRIRTGNQKVDADMIEDEKYFFDGRLLGNVIDCRAREKQNKTKTVDACAHDPRRIAVCGRDAGQYRKAADTEYNADGMYQSIYDFLLPGVA